MVIRDVKHEISYFPLHSQSRVCMWLYIYTFIEKDPAALPPRMERMERERRVGYVGILYENERRRSARNI